MACKKKYFTLTTQSGNPVPQVINWYGKLDIRKITQNAYRELPKHVLLSMKTGMDVFYPDILIDPILMVSCGVMDVIQMYDESIPFLFAALFDSDKEESVSYFIPVLADGNANSKEVLYRVEKPGGHEIRIELELVESLLIRGATGMELSAVL